MQLQKTMTNDEQGKEKAMMRAHVVKMTKGEEDGGTYLQGQVECCGKSSKGIPRPKPWSQPFPAPWNQQQRKEQTTKPVPNDEFTNLVQ